MGTCHFIQLSALPASSFLRKSAYGFAQTWLAYGEDNLAPLQLLELSRLSPTHGGIVRRKAEYTAGKNILAKDTAANDWAKTLDQGDGLHNLLYKCALDLHLYGGFCVQVLWKKQLPLVHTILHQELSAVRLGTESFESARQGVWISEDWQDTYRCKPQFFPFFDPNSPAEEPVFLYFKRYEQGAHIYPAPDWQSAYKSILTEIELINFKHSNIVNSFTPSGMLKLPAKIKPEQIEKMKNDIKKELTGTSAAGKIMLVAADGENTVEWIPFNTSPVEKDVSAYLEQARQEIVSAHRLPSPTLIGLPGGASLAGDGNTITQASKEFFEKVIGIAQNMILGQFAKLFSSAGFDTELVIEQNNPLNA